MPLPVESWREVIEPNLYPGAEFLSESQDLSQFIEGDVLHVPQTGIQPIVYENATMFPLPVTEREDAELTTNTVRLKTGPIVLRKAEQYYLSYAKRESIIGQHLDVLRERMCQIALHAWVPTQAVETVLTTGATTGALPPSATGTRRRVEQANVVDLFSILTRMDAPTSDRVMLVDAALETDIRLIPDFMRADAMGQSNIPSGMIGTLYGARVYVRSRLPIFNATTRLVRPRGSAVAPATDSHCILLYHKRAVGRGLSPFDVQEDAVVRPEYGGRLMSAEAQYQAIRLRSNAIGSCTAAIVQNNA
jgi:hypothetical protein